MKRLSQITIDWVGQVAVIEFLTENLMDVIAVDDLNKELLSFIADEKPHYLIVSFTVVRSCSTSVINTLLIAKKRLLSFDGELRLCQVSDSIRHTLRILNLDGTVFEIHDTLNDALASLGVEPGTHT